MPNRSYSQRTIVVLFCSFFFSAQVLGEDFEPCKAASAKPSYEAAVAVPDVLKKKIETYREKWRALCDLSGKKKKPTLAELYEHAGQIEADFREAIFIEFSKNPDRVLQDGHRDKVHDLVEQKYPSFVPAFEGSYLEHEFFRPLQSAFAAKADRGTAEDKAFWSGFIELRGTGLMSPWVEQTWDYGGCLRFGEFDWVKEMEKLDALKKKVKASAYVELLAKFEDDLVEPFRASESANAVCTCTKKEAVLTDLKKIEKHFVGIGRSTTLASKLKRHIARMTSGIEKKNFKVNSQAEAHCSGG